MSRENGRVEAAVDKFLFQEPLAVEEQDQLKASLDVPEATIFPTIVFPTGENLYGDIPASAFFSRSDLTGLVLGNDVTSIGSSAFAYCSGFTGPLAIPNSVTSIGDSAFQDCSGFTGSLTLPNSVTSIGSGAFAFCYDFTGPLAIPNSVTSIGDSAFSTCSGFTGSLTIPNSVISIGNYAFTNCSGFNGSLVISNSVTNIGSYAFYGCSGFTGSLVIPNSVVSIGSYVFVGCSNLASIDLYVEKSVIDASNCLIGSSIITVRVRASDSTWTAGSGQTIGGKSGITVVKIL